MSETPVVGKIESMEGERFRRKYGGDFTTTEFKPHVCVEKDLRARVAELLRKIETGSEGMCPDCMASIDAGDRHRKGCALATLLKECEG